MDHEKYTPPVLSHPPLTPLKSAVLEVVGRHQRLGKLIVVGKCVRGRALVLMTIVAAAQLPSV